MRRLIREHPEIILDILRERPDVVAEALMIAVSRPEILTRIMATLLSLPMSILLNFTRLASSSTYTETDVARRLSSIEEILSRVESSMVTRGDLERIIKENCKCSC